MTPRYNWPAMVRDIMDTAFLPQEKMAAKLKVSQQSISCWLNGTRNPSAETIPELLKLAQESGIDISFHWKWRRRLHWLSYRDNPSRPCWHWT